MDEKTEDGVNEDDLAASVLVAELARVGRVITFIGDMMLERLDELDHPGTSGEDMVLRQMIGSVLPELGLVGAEPCRQAAGLIHLICNQIVLDFQLTLQGDERRN